MITKALLEGLVWSVMWIFYVYVLLRWFPWEMVHEYPEDVKQACTLPEPDEKQKKSSKFWGGLVSVIILITLAVFGIEYFRNADFSFFELFLFLFIIGQTWNVVDLIIMDFLIVCTLRPKWVVLPGTEGCAGYGDYFFHFKGFLIGCVYTAIMALIIAGIDWAVLRFLMG